MGSIMEPIATDLSEDKIQYTTGGIILSVQKHDEGKFEVEQVETQARVANPPAAGFTSVVPFDFTLSPFRIRGRLDTRTFATEVSVSVASINIGRFSGDVRKGITISIDLVIANGSIRLYVKNNHELWLHIDVTVLGQRFQEDVKILAW